jgi:hypothetical protein
VRRGEGRWGRTVERSKIHDLVSVGIDVVHSKNGIATWERNEARKRQLDGAGGEVVIESATGWSKSARDVGDPVSRLGSTIVVIRVRNLKLVDVAVVD